MLNIDGLKDSVVFGSIGVRIFPHTNLYERALAEKTINKDTNLLEPVFYFLRVASFSVRRRGLEADKTNAFHLFGYRGPVWDYILKKGETRRKQHGLG